MGNLSRADGMMEVLIVGAGPAGIGCALALKACGLRAQLVDAEGVGAAFTRWPLQMRLITPSFHSNPFGSADLNAITPDTSPADFLHTQHPDGREYARYLRALVAHHGLLLDSPTRVTAVVPREDGFFDVETNRGRHQARFVVWAAGEYGQPDDGGISGAEICLHNSRVRDWDEVALEGDQFVVIGGYESGIDAVVNLMERGKEVRVLSRGEPWGMDDPDPSRSLSPRTRDRLRKALLEAPGQVRFYQKADIIRVSKIAGGYELEDADGVISASVTRPILCTGFQSALEQPMMRALWNWRGGQPVLSETADESTLTPGLFYSGPSLQHRGMLFCFIYKFRSRFGVIAREIAQRLGREWDGPLTLWRERGFMLDDLDCCADCQCAVEAEETVNPEVLDYAARA